MRKSLCEITSLFFGTVITYFHLRVSTFQKRALFKMQLLLNENKLFSSVFVYYRSYCQMTYDVIIARHMLLKMLKFEKSSICHLNVIMKIKIYFIVKQKPVIKIKLLRKCQFYIRETRKTILYMLRVV